MRIALITLGCPKNLVDAEVMLGLLDEAGHTLVDDPRGADLAVVNTCSFISSAVEESKTVVEECVALKRDGLLGGVLVAGCLPQRYGDDTFDVLPGVDGVVGCSAFDRIVEAAEALAAARRIAIVEEPVRVYDHLTPRVLATPSHLAYVKISEGCDNRCHYCTIPSIRGTLRSRDADSIVEEARALLDVGVRELNLIAQDTTAYGTDIASHSLLPSLIARLSGLGVPWIRLLYTHPARVTDELLSTMATEAGIVPYLDVPIQHVSDGLLAAMGRGIDGAGIRSLLERARGGVPGLTVRSSVMVGFPGEGEEEFEELLSFVEEGHIDHLGVFEFSPEPGTPAAGMRPEVPREVASARAKLLVETMEELAAARGRRLLGTSATVLVDVAGEEARGRTAGQAWEMDGHVTIEGPPAALLNPGEFAEVTFTGASGFDLVARALPGAQGT
jgi:ribosomal protein S12 methylthiotransferase